jgi:adenine-specific DNA-methyltransferase
MPDPVRWGPDNPHPLLPDEDGIGLGWQVRSVRSPPQRGTKAGAACPRQKIETVDMPRSEALASCQTTFGELSTTLQEDFRNRLIWGDNKLVMASLLKEFRGKIDLIYIDPPFDVGADFTMHLLNPENDTSVNLIKSDSILQ